MPEGFLSTHLVGGVAPGTIVRLAAPQGNFVLPDPAPASVLFLTGGLRDHPGDVDAAHAGPPRADRRYRPRAFGAQRESDVMFAAELAELARAHEGYRLTVRTTRTQGRLDLSRLDDEVPDWRERQTWACGPEGMLDAAERVWAGGRDRRPTAPGALRGVAGGARTARAARSPSRAAARPSTSTRATSLMEAGEQAGVQMPFGCRMGICQSCVVGLVDGHVRDLRTGAEHEPGSRVQTCVSAASGDCVLDV